MPALNIRHGAFAAALLPFSTLVGAIAFYLYQTGGVGPGMEPVFYALALGAPVLWLWGFLHLTLHFKLSPLWVILGLTFIPGLAILFWAGGNQPRWEQQRIRKLAAKHAKKNPSPTPAPNPKAGKPADVPPPR